MMKRILFSAFALLLACAEVHAQAQLGAGTVWGNSTAARAPPKETGVSALLDRALGSTRGAIIERGASGWAIVGPGTTGKPWVSNGAGADPAYQTLGVVGGGTGLASGTSGGIPCFTAGTTMASSNALTANAIIVGGGAGVCPAPLGSLGTTTTVLHGNASGVPSFGAVVSADLSITTTSCTNQFVSAISATAVGTCSTVSIGQVGGLGTGVATAAGTNLSAAGGLTTTIASGTSALGTSAISSATCATVVTTAATNTATTDVIMANFNSDPTAVTGYVPLTSGMLTIIVYPTSGNVNFKVCNNTAGSITPGAITLNWRVVR